MLGRRYMIWLAMGLIIVGATLQTSAYSIAHLIVGRIITGFGTGIDSSTVPMYQSELSKREWRGRLVSWEILFIGVGIVIVSDNPVPTILRYIPESLTFCRHTGSTLVSHSWTLRHPGELPLPFNSSLQSLSLSSFGAFRSLLVGLQSEVVWKKHLM